MDAPNVDSNNHNFLGDVSSWMIQNLGGIKPNPQGYRGKLSVRWDRVEEGIRLAAEVPAGMKGKQAFLIFRR